MEKILSLNSYAIIFTVIALIAISFGSITAALAEGGEGKGCSGHKGKMFEKTDANNDGVISYEEFSAKAERRFKKMDANSDGKVTKEEANSHHAAMREKYKKHHQENKATY